MWVGQIGELEVARRASQSALLADNVLSLVDGNLTTVATAQAACYTNEALLQIQDQVHATQCATGFQVASNMGGTFGSTFDALYDSLPDNNDKQVRMITG